MKKNFFVLIILLFSASCVSITPPKLENEFYTKAMTKFALMQIKDNGKLLVLTRYAPTIYYINPDGKPAGFEYDLMNEFADYLGVKTEYIVLHSVSEVLKSIKLGHGDIATAGLAMTEKRVDDDFIFGDGYHNVVQQVVCKKTRRSKLPTNFKKLQRVKLLVTKDSSYVETLQKLQKKYRGIHWEESAALSTEDIFQKINNRKVNCTIADSNIFNFNRKFYPRLTSTMTISDEQTLAWIVAPWKVGLAYVIDDWMTTFRKSKKYREIEERHFGHVEDKFKQGDAATFHRNVAKRLPRYKKLFIAAGKKYGFPWRLLAAASYQESGWLRKQVSRAGASGLMMLMPRTAKELKVTDRFNPKQSIFGGARYLKRMMKNLPDEINENDKYWYALASYNIGRGHVLDAMKLCDITGKNKYSWMDVKEMLPKLKYKKYRKYLKYGWARGSETVRYVDNIKTYWEILETIDLTS